MNEIIDNKTHATVAGKLKEIIKSGDRLSIISSFFTIYAYQELKAQLDQIEELRFLFVEPAFVKDITAKQVREYEINKTPQELGLGGNDFELKLRNELKQSAIARECADWIKRKVSMRSFKTPSMSPIKLFHVDGGQSAFIHGNSDFTADGLGCVPSKNFYMNTFSSDATLSRSMLDSFNSYWQSEQLTEDVKDKVLDCLLNIYKENPPEFVYYVTLFTIFKEYLAELDEDNVLKTRTGFKNTVIWNKLYKFQKDGVLGAIDKLEKYNGCIIADSVGLGKTFEALAVIKYYELRNSRVLVLTPKKLRENWIIYRINDKRNILVADRFNFDVLNHTDLSRYTGASGDLNLETLNWNNYDLLVIDESHNFRNNDPRKDHETRYSRLLNKVIKEGVKTKVLLLSATPVNNRMTDLKNQIAFITEGDDRALLNEGIHSVEATLKNAQAVFNRWNELPDERRTLDAFLERISSEYFSLLDTLTIARSRKHIQKYYDISEIGEFPERLKPDSIKSDIDTRNTFPPLKEVNNDIKRLKLAAYSPMQYVLREKQAEYSEKYDIYVKDGSSMFKQADRENSLIGLMRVNLLKRMESSIYSFALTVEKLLETIHRLVEKIDSFDGEYDEYSSILDLDLDDEELDDNLIGNNVKVLLQDVDRIRWKQDLLADSVVLEHLLKESRKIVPARDAKLQDLKAVIADKLKQSPYNPSNRKILLFTAFADTADYLYENLAQWIKQDFSLDSALVTGSVENRTTLDLRHTSFDTVLALFSPISKEKDKLYPHLNASIEVLIATDCISEGQNLQDCDCVINYDIHWNPVRIIQRFGRIDRLGSCNKQIKLINFWPNMELDEYIKLEARVKGRMVLVDVSATGEENIIDTSQKKMNDLEYRKKQLERLQTEVFDLEDMGGGISLTDMTFNDFRMDLHDYVKENPDQLNKAPTGIHAVVNLPPEFKEELGPGVLFCLRQITDKGRKAFNNALYPYCLVYVNEDGTVKQGYIHPKKNLDLFRKICSGKKQVIPQLVELFKAQTDDGRNMQQYSDLLDCAVNDICGTEEEKGIASLFTKGGTSIVHDKKSKDDFELISFLVVK